MLNMATLLESTARMWPEKTAVIDGLHSLTYAELDRWANRIANGLTRAGILPRERVALVCPTSRFFIACYFGILKCGATAVPLNILLRREHLRTQLEFAGADACICHVGAPGLPLAEEITAAMEGLSRIRHLWFIPGEYALPAIASGREFAELESGQPDCFDNVMCASDDAAIINFTSGTTGIPKAAEISHASEMITVHPWAEVLGIQRHDVVAGAVGLFMGFGRSAMMNPALRVGATLLLLPKFEPQAMFDAMAQHRATIFVGVPAMYHALWRMGESGARNLASLADHWRLGVYGGAPMNSRLRRALRDILGVRLLQGYGLTETGPLAYSPALGAEEYEEDMLTPLWGGNVRVVDDRLQPVGPGEVGEVVVRGPMVMNAYYNNPAANEAAFRGGWFHTGDAARIKKPGVFCLVDRMVETVNRGGYKVYPAEIERTLMEHPDVDRAAVKGIPHARLGQEIVAYFLLKKETLQTEDRLFTWARDRLPKYAYPRIVKIVDALPIGPTGKVIKGELPIPPVSDAEQ